MHMKVGDAPCCQAVTDTATFGALCSCSRPQQAALAASYCVNVLQCFVCHCSTLVVHTLLTALGTVDCWAHCLPLCVQREVPGVPFGVQGLQDVIGLSVTHPTWQRSRPDNEADKHTGWAFVKPGDPPLSSATGKLHLLCELGPHASVPTALTFPCSAWPDTLRHVVRLHGNAQRGQTVTSPQGPQARMLPKLNAHTSQH